jgi:hypothetical protein
MIKVTVVEKEVGKEFRISLGLVDQNTNDMVWKKDVVVVRVDGKGPRVSGPAFADLKVVELEGFAAIFQKAVQIIESDGHNLSGMQVEVGGVPKSGEATAPAETAPKKRGRPKKVVLDAKE